MASATSMRCFSTLVSGDRSLAALPSRRSAPFPGCCFPPKRAPAAAVKLRATAEVAPDPAAGAAPKRKPRGITKPRPVSPELQAVVGEKEIPRTQALKKIWAYIKEKDLQDPENKRIIVCDDKLKTIFGGRDRVGFLEVSGLLNPHFIK